MKFSYKEDLNRLELLSRKIEDLISKNNFEHVLVFYHQRRKIIDKIKKESRSLDKNQFHGIIDVNKCLVKNVEDKMKHLTSNHNKFSKRIKFYSLSK
jgi:hypothetical protein